MPKLGMEAIRRRQVIDAVVRILSTKGWHELTIREVSDVAGVSAGVVTHYFVNKRTMVVDAIADTRQELMRRLSLLDEGMPDARQRIAAAADLLTLPEAFGLPHGNFWIALYGRLPLDEVVQVELQRLQLGLVAWVTRIIRQGIDCGDFRSRHAPEDVAASFVALVLGQAVAAAASPADLPSRRARRLLLDRIGDSLGTSFEETTLAGVG